jgi:hypothetical protein
MTDLVVKIILLIVIITVLVFIILKELKKRRAEIIEKNKNSFSKKEKKIIKKEIESNENKKSLKIVQEKPSELSKLLFNLEEMVDREDDGDYEKQNKENLNFFSTVINNDSSFKKSAQDTIVLEEEDLKSINKHLNLKLGSELSSMIQRVDENGNIVLGMEAFRFITGEHIPLITPSGAIRVLNLLTVEDDILLSIQTGKPLFILDKKNNTVNKIEQQELELLVKYKDELDLKQITDNNIKEIKELSERNAYLEKNIDELKTEILKLEAKNELYENLVKTNPQVQNKTNSNVIKNETPLEKIEENKEVSAKEKTISKESKATPNIDANENKNESIVSTLDSLYKIENKENVTRNEKEISNATEIKEEKPIVQKTIEQEIKNTKPPASDIVNKPKENFLNNVQIETVSTNEVSQDIQEEGLKSLNKKTSEKVIEDFFLEFLLRKNGGDNRETKIDELNFITYEHESFSKEYLLRYLYKNTIKLLKKFLIENGYKDDSKNLDLVINNERVDIKNDAYFLNSKNMQLYKSKVIQIRFTQDDVSPYALINEKQNGYKGGLTKEENRKLMERTLERKLAVIYERNLNNIENEEFIVVDDK